MILVGGGTILVRAICKALRRPAAGASPVANAIGAAIAQVGGEVDRVFAVEGTTRDAVLGSPSARRPTGRSPPAPNRMVKIVDVEDVPLAYLPGNATRIRVKAVGDLAMRQWSDFGIPIPAPHPSCEC